MKNIGVFVVFFVYVSMVYCQVELWYHYSMENRSIGLGQVSYQLNHQEKLLTKKQSKYRFPSYALSEQTNAVLSSDGTVRSAHITETLAGQSVLQFCMISVSDHVLIQNSEGVKTFPLKKFYLEPSDFLRFLTQFQKLSFGKMFQGYVLSTKRDDCIQVKARYLGQETWACNLQESSCHVWEVTTAELKGFWAKAYLSGKGDLLGYELGNFRVTHIPEVYAQDRRKIKPTIPAQMLLDRDEITELECSVGQNAGMFLVRANQTVQGSQVFLRGAKIVNPNIAWKEITQNNAMHIQPTTMFPSNHPFVLRYTNEIRYGSQTPFGTAQNIVRWCYQNLQKKITPKGQSFDVFLGSPSSLPAIATVVLCRSCGIPARIVSGFRYEPGRWVYSTWAEIFLGQWFPVEQGNIGSGAIFLAMVEDALWPEKEFSAPMIQIQSLQKFGQKIVMEKLDTQFLVTNNQVADLLLGLRFQCPEGWVIMEQSNQNDHYLLCSSQNPGWVIVVQVVELHVSLEEFVQSVAEKLGLMGKPSQKKVEIEMLWQRPRPFPQSGGVKNIGQAVEVALQAVNQGYVYRAFLGQIGTKAIFTGFSVPQNQLEQIEPHFQQFVRSIRFMENPAK